MHGNYITLIGRIENGCLMREVVHHRKTVIALLKSKGVEVCRGTALSGIVKVVCDMYHGNRV